MNAPTVDEFAPLRSLADPPRFVPPSLRLGIMFGGFLNQFGWFFFGFGMIFYWAFAANADFESLYFLGDLETKRGVVTSVEANVGMDEGQVWKIGYKFTVAGIEREQLSYYVGDVHTVGANATIEFPVGNPDRSRIKGGTSRPMPIWNAFFVVIPLIGMILLTIGFRRGRRIGRLLVEGALAVGELVGREETDTEINDRPVVRFHYEYPANDGNIYAATASTHNAETLADERQPLLYDPRNPGDATLLAHLPCRPKVDELGQLQPLTFRQVVLAMFVPATSIVGHGAVALWRLASNL